MIKRTVILFALAVTAQSASAISPALLTLAQQDSRQALSEIESGQLLVKVKSGQSKKATSALRSVGASVVQNFPQIGWTVVKFPTSRTVASVISSFKKSGGFSVSEAVPKSYFLEIPNDPMVGVQYSIGRMQLDQAWGYSHGSDKVIVGVIDSGFDVGHPDFKELNGVSVFDPRSRNFGDGVSTDLTDTVGHGTHVAGTVGAVANNGIGIAGNGYGVRILGMKVATAAGGVSPAGYLNAILAAGDAGVPICNISIGSSQPSAAQQDAIAYSTNKGTLFFCAAGNSGVPDKNYPAAYPDCIAVGASDQNDQRADFSQYGADWVDIAAPGVNVRSLIPGGYADYDGTSMASPNAAGVAGLVLSSAGGPGSLNSQELRGVVENSTDPIGNWVAYGRVNAYRAVLDTPSLTDTAAIDSAVAMEGSVTNANRGTLRAVDGVSTIVNSIRKKGTGLYGSLDTTFTPTSVSTAQIRSADVSFTVKADKLAAVQVFLYDPAAARWVHYSTTSGSGAAKTVTFKLDRTTLDRYQINEDLRMLVRSFVPERLASRASKSMQIDQMQVVFRAIGTR